MSENLKLARELWERLDNIPINDEEELDEDFVIEELNIVFEIGTDRQYVWHWFEETFDLSVAEDLLNLNKEIMKNTAKNIEEYLDNLEDSELLNIHREYLEKINSLDDDIYYNDEEFFEIYFPGKVMDAIRAIQFGEYNFTDAYVKFNGYGNLETTNHLEDFIDVSELAEYIHENPWDFDIEFDEEDEDEEE